MPGLVPVASSTVPNGRTASISIAASATCTSLVPTTACSSTVAVVSAVLSGTMTPTSVCGTRPLVRSTCCTTAPPGETKERALLWSPWSVTGWRIGSMVPEGLGDLANGLCCLGVVETRTW